VTISQGNKINGLDAFSAVQIQKRWILLGANVYWTVHHCNS